tara:strand:- start:1413 stop:3029 length:1617 start_codon:yes stop_codon:yes gene_type:complete
MAIDKIKTIVVEDDAVTQPKIAAGAITNTELNKTVITGLTELSSADVADADQLIIYDASADTLKKVTKARTTNLDFPVYTSVSPATSQTADGGNITFTITGSGFTAGTNARLISNTGQKLDFTTVTRTNTTTITGTIARSSLLVAQSPYDIQIINGEGLSVLGANQINIDEFPVFITASGSLGTPNEGTSVNILVEARDPDSSSAITFELQSGSLPAGLSLVNTSEDSCRITGTLSAVASTTVSNFVLRAFDTASNTASRAFSITATNVPVTTSFTSSGTFAVPSGVAVADVLVVAGGGGSGANHAGGGGAGGLVFFPCTPITPGGTIAITVGCGGAGGSASDDLDSGDNGQDSVFGASPSPGLGQGGVLTAKGGGGGGTGQSGNATVGLDGGSGGGAAGIGNASPTAGGSAIQTTQPGNSGAYGFGNAGGSGVRPNPQNNYSGGGGGAGAAGETGGQGGDGGIGKAYTIADGTSPVYYAGGGGGGRYASSQAYVQTQGGQGGGGVSNPCATVGSANSGGGGGAPQKAGGKGIVIVRY